MQTDSVRQNRLRGSRSLRDGYSSLRERAGRAGDFVARLGQLLHVVRVDLEGLFPGEVRVGFLFDEEVLNGTGADGFEDGGVVRGALAKLGGGRWIADGAAPCAAFEVLDVEHLDAVRVGAEVVLGATAADGDPAAVHFKDDEFGIGVVQEEVVGDGGGLVVGLRSKLHGVVVIAELEAGLVDLLAPAVELFGVPFPVVESEGTDLLVERQVSRGGLGAKAGKRTDDVVRGAESGVEVEDGVECLLELRGGIVGGDAAQAGGGHGGLDLGGGVIVEASGLDFAVAEGAEGLEGAEIVLLKLVADGVELQAEWQAERVGPGGKTSGECECGGGSGRGLEKAAAGGAAKRRGLVHVGRFSGLGGGDLECQAWNNTDSDTQDDAMERLRVSNGVGKRVADGAGTETALVV
jgi:hypothetical protein